MAEFKLRLLSLPPDAQKNVLRTMDYAELIGFSLCSKSTKNQASSLKYKASKLNLVASIFFEIKIHFASPLDRTFFEKISASPSRNELKIYRQSGPYQREAVGQYRIEEDFEMETWISHFAHIFHKENLDNVRIYGEEMLVEDIQNAIGRMTFLTLQVSSLNDEYREYVHGRLVPRDVITNQKHPLKSSSKVLLQNLKVLHLADCRNWKLDDLLMLNTKLAQIFSLNLTSKDLNRFLKLWMRGSNPNLFFIECTILSQNLDRTEIKKGIDGLEMPEETTRTIEQWLDAASPYRIQFEGGFDIRRTDGTLGTLFFLGEIYFNFVVWQ